MPTEPSRFADSPSLDANLAPTDSETESDEEVPGINVGDQDEGQVGPNPGVQDEGQARPNSGVQDEGQAGSNPSDVVESQPQSSHVVHAGPNLEHMDLKATDASTQQNTEQMDEEFTTTAYPNVQENLKLLTEDQFLEEKPQEDEPEKTNTESEVRSMVTVPIHQDTYSVPPMATLVIDLTISHPVSTTVHAPLPISTATTTTITTTTSLPPPPPQPQQSSSDPILLQRIGELEQHIADLIQSNLALEERKYSNNGYLEEARRKKIKKHASLRTPFGSPPSQPPPPPPPASISGAPGTSGALGSSQFPSPPPPPSTGTSGSPQQQGSKAPSSSKTAASTPQSMAWTTSDTRYESTSVSSAHESYPTDSLMNEDSILEEQV
ncbi:hypothetical protein Tco_0534952 [Tanacetum coccineum]